MNKKFEFRWSFLLEHLIGEKTRGDLQEEFDISYPTVIRLWDFCEKIESSDTVYTGVYLDTIDSVYVSEISFTQEKTGVVKFSDITPVCRESNRFVNLPNRNELLLRYYQKKYAANHIRVKNAIVIEGNSVTAMINGHIFEKLGNFTSFNISFILEAYQPEMIIAYEKERGNFDRFKDELDFITMKNQGKVLLREFITPEVISIANANWGIYLSVIDA